MDSSVIITILSIFSPVLTLVLGGLGALWMVSLNKKREASQIKADQDLATLKLKSDQDLAMTRLKMMKENGLSAVQYVEQVFPDRPAEEKAALALSFAQVLNLTAKISVPDEIQKPLNEANVLTLPPIRISTTTVTTSATGAVSTSVTTPTEDTTPTKPEDKEITNANA